MEKPILLASSSPRRAELLQRVKIPFEAFAPHVDETFSAALSIEENLKQVAAKKAGEAASQVEWRESYAGILAADTAVVKDGRVFGKPRDRAEAANMLRALSGGVHQVCTGLAFLTPGGGEFCIVDTSNVFFKTLSAGEVEDYVASEEPYDKAGGYAIQGGAAKFVEKVEGDYYNVVGLPMRRLYEILQKAGYRVDEELFSLL